MISTGWRRSGMALTLETQCATSFPGHAEIAGRLAQLVEHLVYTERVGGSSPSPPTIANY